MQNTNNCNCKNDTAMSSDQQIKQLTDHVRFLTEQFSEQVALDPTDPKVRGRASLVAESMLRIIGGQKVPNGAFPECCLVGDTSAGGFLQEWFCTGSLIHPKIVLTANHCILQTTGRLRPNSIALGVGDEDDVKPDNIIPIAKIVKHSVEDVALLILHRPATQPPVPVAPTNEIISADRVELVGFGNTDPHGMIGFGTKRQVKVNMNVVRKSDTEDLSAAEMILGFDSYNEFVAGRKGSGKDSCNGDSGGPAYILVEGDYKLAGVTSRATHDANYACGDGGIYVRVDKLSDWIDDTINRYT